MNNPVLALAALSLVSISKPAAAQFDEWIQASPPRPYYTYTAPAPAQPADQDLEIAIRYAPVIRAYIQAQTKIHDAVPRADAIVKFDFDGDFRGINNWDALANTKNKLNAYVYYSVTETTGHYFITYALYHPRDNKGSKIPPEWQDKANEWFLNKGGKIVKAAEKAAEIEAKWEILKKQGVYNKLSGGMKDFGKTIKDIAISHENDLEGILVVVEKGKDGAEPRLLFMETQAHNMFPRYAVNPGEWAVETEKLEVEGTHPVIHVQPSGHGIYGDDTHMKDLGQDYDRFQTYRYKNGEAQDSQAAEGDVDYALEPIYSTLWKRSDPAYSDSLAKFDEMYATDPSSLKYDYGTFKVQALEAASGNVVAREAKVGVRGSTFHGEACFKNKARPPWGWFDMFEMTGNNPPPLGEWFLNPASAIARHFKLDADKMPQVYVSNPYLGISERK
jgi:hypothetical protein